MYKTSKVPENIASAPERRVPRFGTFAGVGGVIVYMTGFIPIIIGVFIYAAIQYNEKSATDPTITMEEILEDITSNLWLVVAILISQSVMFLIYAFFVSRLRGSGNFFNDFGLKFKWYSPFFIFVGIGLQVFGVISGVPFVLLRDGDTPQQEIVSNVADSKGLAFIAFAILVGLLVPTIEEICFRGLLQRGLLKHLSPFVAISISSVVFAGVHLSDPNVIFALTQLLVVGLVCGILTGYSGRIDMAIFTHIGFNLTTVLIISIA